MRLNVVYNRAKYASALSSLRLISILTFSNGMINISPVGRNASIQERNDYEKYDKQHNIRADFVNALKKEFSDYGLT